MSHLPPNIAGIVFNPGIGPICEPQGEVFLAYSVLPSSIRPTKLRADPANIIKASPLAYSFFHFPLLFETSPLTLLFNHQFHQNIMNSSKTAASGTTEIDGSSRRSASPSAESNMPHHWKEQIVPTSYVDRRRLLRNLRRRFGNDFKVQVGKLINRQHPSENTH
jgi:hypothetical protein